MQHIDVEINKSNCFAGQVDETTDITCHSQHSVIIRSVKNEEDVMESFMGFYDVSSRRTSKNLFLLLTKTFRKFNLEKKIIAQTYNRAAVMACHLNGLQVKIKFLAPQASFTHFKFNFE